MEAVNSLRGDTSQLHQYVGYSGGCLISELVLLVTCVNFVYRTISFNPDVTSHSILHIPKVTSLYTCSCFYDEQFILSTSNIQYIHVYVYIYICVWILLAPHFLSDSQLPLVPIEDSNLVTGDNFPRRISPPLWLWWGSESWIRRQCLSSYSHLCGCPGGFSPGGLQEDPLLSAFIFKR